MALSIYHGNCIYIWMHYLTCDMFNYPLSKWFAHSRVSEISQLCFSYSIIFPTKWVIALMWG